MNRHGFSLLELVVAIAIIASGVFAITSLNLSSSQGSDEAVLRYQAMSLAREGIEVVRAVRDSNWLAGCPDPNDAARCTIWNRGLANNADYTAVPIFNHAINQWSLDFNPDAPTAIRHRSDNDLLTQAADGGMTIGMDRLIELWPICRNQATDVEIVLAREGETCPIDTVSVGIDVRVRVLFERPGGRREVVLEERLYDWR